MFSYFDKTRIRNFFLGSTAFLILPVAIFSSKAMVPLIILMSLALFTLKINPEKFFKPRNSWPLIGFGLLLTWAGFSQLWTFDNLTSAKLILPLTTLILLGFLLIKSINQISPKTNCLISQGLLAGTCLAIAILLFESVTGNWLTRFGRGWGWYDVIKFSTGGINIEAFVKNGIGILTILIWPTFSILLQQHKKILATIILLSVFYIVHRFNASTAGLALIIAATLSYFAFYRQKLTSIILASLFALSVLSTPFVINHTIGAKSVEEMGQISFDAKLPGSAINRLIIWQFSAKRIFEQPFAGWGMNTARAIPGGNEKYTLRVKFPDGKTRTIFRESYLPLHPHNLALQVWLELGSVGAVIVAVFGWLFIRRLGQPDIDPSLIGVTVSILLFNFLSFGAWQSWWVATQFLCLILALGATRKIQME